MQVFGTRCAPGAVRIILVVLLVPDIRFFCWSASAAAGRYWASLARLHIRRPLSAIHTIVRFCVNRLLPGLSFGISTLHSIGARAFLRVVHIWFVGR